MKNINDFTTTLRKYFETDFPNNLKLSKDITVKNKDFEEKISLKIIFDFNSSTKYLSLYIPNNKFHQKICHSLLNKIEPLLEVGNSVEIDSKLPGEKFMNSNNLKFSGRIFIYNENKTSDSEIEKLEKQAGEKKLHLQYRGIIFSTKRSKIEKPIAFISHDSRDKDSIAKPIAVELSKMMCPVWFDEFSLKAGDNLRESIEKGIKESKVCIVILSKNFLSNSGWTKTEFDSIFTKELVESKKNIITYMD